MIFETPRLIVREADFSDAEGFFEMDGDPEVARFLGAKPVVSIEKCLEIIAFLQKQYKTRGVGRWSVIEKSTGNFVGWCGLKRVLPEDDLRPEIGEFIDLGYRFSRKNWGRGFATESAKAALEHGFGPLGFSKICAMADARNDASIHVLEKIGLEKIGPDFLLDGQTHIWMESI